MSRVEPENSSAQTSCQPVAPDELLLDVLLELEELLLEELLDELELLDEELEEVPPEVVPGGLLPPQAVVSRQDKNNSDMRCTVRPSSGKKQPRQGPGLNRYLSSLARGKCCYGSAFSLGGNGSGGWISALSPRGDI